MTSSCPYCLAGEPVVLRGVARVHSAYGGAALVSCAVQPGADPEAFNRAVDAVVEAVGPWDPDDEAAYQSLLQTALYGAEEYETPWAYSYAPCPVCGRMVLPGDATAGQMLGRALHARCCAEHTADVDDYNGREGRR